MISVVDTNILLDIFGADPYHGYESSMLLRRCLKEGALHACEVVWVETGTAFPNQQACKAAMETLTIEFSPITQETALIASQVWRDYRQNGGKRERVVADFLIGAHALLQGNRLVTRDRGFYRKYFKSLTVLDPTEHANKPKGVKS